MRFTPVRWKTPTTLMELSKNFPVAPTQFHITQSLSPRNTSLFHVYSKEAKLYRAIFFALTCLFITIALAATQLTYNPHLHWILGSLIPAKLLLVMACILCATATSFIAAQISPNKEPILRTIRKARRRLQKLYLRHSRLCAVCEKYQCAREEMEEKQEEFIGTLTNILECQVLSTEEKRQIKERLLWELKNQLEIIIHNYRWHLADQKAA